VSERMELRIKTDALGRIAIGEAQRIAGCSRWTLRRMVSEGRFPEPIADWDRGRKRFWKNSAVQDWIAKHR